MDQCATKAAAECAIVRVMRRMIRPLALLLADLLGRSAHALRRAFPSNDELRLRVIFGELSLAEAERRAGHILGCSHVADIEDENAVRGSAA